MWFAGCGQKFYGTGLPITIIKMHIIILVHTFISPIIMVAQQHKIQKATKIIDE